MSLRTDFKRILKSGMLHVWRNGLVTFASVLVMTLTMLLISLLVFTNAVMSNALDQIANRVDVNVYFLPSTPEEVVLLVQNELEQLPEVAQVDYVSDDDAIADFRERHKDDALTIQALDEIGINPFGASLNIRATDPSQYESIALFLGPDGGLSDDVQFTIEKVNYYQNELIIKRVSHMINSVQRLGTFMAIVFGILAIVMTVNTLRVAMYASREEISVMRMVGADSRFVRGPFYVAGLIYGLVGSLIALIVLYPMTSWIAQRTTVFFGGFNLFNYYTGHFIWLVLFMVAASMVIGVVSSAIAIQTYLSKR